MCQLDLAHRHHLLAKIVLVFSYRSFPSRDCLVLADHDFLGDLVEQPEIEVSIECEERNGIGLLEIVRHDNHTTRESIDSVGERVNSWDIKTVGRLVK